MKIGSVTLALNDEATIAGTINCLKDYVDFHIVLISERSYFGDVIDNGETEKICEKLGVEYIKGCWPLDHHQRTLGNKMCKKAGCDWVLTFDSDELMDKDNIAILKNDIETQNHRAFVCKPEVYWKTTDYRLRPIPNYMPVIATKSDVTFPYIRNIDCAFGVTNALMHHISWCHPKDIYKKVTCYAHATDFDGAKWYRENYVNWQYPNQAVLHDGKYDVIKEPLPEELSKCLFQI